MAHCEDCGTKLDGGICPNCQEELYIFENQNEYLPEHVSEEFFDKVVEQNKNRK